MARGSCLLPGRVGKRVLRTRYGTCWKRQLGLRKRPAPRVVADCLSSPTSDGDNDEDTRAASDNNSNIARQLSLAEFPCFRRSLSVLWSDDSESGFTSDATVG